MEIDLISAVLPLHYKRLATIQAQLDQGLRYFAEGDKTMTLLQIDKLESRLKELLNYVSQ